VTVPWQSVLGGLTGLKLAVYDDLLLHGEISPWTLSQLPAPRRVETLEAVLIWLQTHRFVRGSGQSWHANPIRQAQEAWEQYGPAESTPAVPAPKPVAAVQAPPRSTPEEPAPTRAVHAHQSEIFSMDGWRR